MENMLLQYRNGKTIRIVYCDQVSENLFVIEMESNRWPYSLNKNVILEAYKENEITILEKDPYVTVVFEEQISLASKKRMERAWNIVNFVLKQLDSEVLIFKSNYRQVAINKAVKTYNVSYITVKNYLIKYWQGGKTKTALLPKFHLIGSKGKDKNVGVKKRGRPRKSGIEGVNIDEKIKKYFRIGLNRYYYNYREISLKTTYELILKDFFTEYIINQDQDRVAVIKDTSKIPTYHQFYYWFNKINNPKKQLIKRQGTRNYYQNYRTILGDSTQDAGLGPGTLWQIDSTQFDIYLVSSVNRNLIVGRPTLICVIDVYSRMIVGINITFESINSYVGTMVALANSMLPKDDYCLQYGIKLEEGEWDVACVPQRILADRGELNSKQIEDAIESLGISIQNAPPYRADYKGIIEQAFAQMNLKVKPFVDGVVKNGKSSINRGEIDYRLKANLTIDEFTKIIIKCVLFHNNYHVLSQYVMDEMMLEENVEKIPVKIWHYGLKNKKGQLRVLDEKTVKTHLLPTDTATITSRGVRFRKMLYASSYSLKNKWYQMARIKGSKKIKIWYDPRDLSVIYTINEEGEFHKLILLDHLSKYRNKGIYEINKLIEFEDSLDEKSKEIELQEKIKLFNDIEGIASAGREKTEAEKVLEISKSKRLKGIRENQKMERMIQRKKIKKNIDSIGMELDIKNPQGTDDELSLFMEIQEMEWDEENE